MGRRDADLRLVESVGNGDPDALGELYEAHAKGMFAAAFRVVRSRLDAADIVHDVFAGLPERLHSFDGRGSVGAWLRMITTRRALVTLRKVNGYHIRTTNRLGQVTTFTPGTGGRLEKIALDVPAGGIAREYVFNYAGSPSILSSVTAPPIGTTARVVTLARTAGAREIDSITDPDGQSESFTYATAPTRITARQGRDGTFTTFAYDAAMHVSQGRVHMNGGSADHPSDLITTIHTADAKGWTPAAADPMLTYTMIDGPRDDIASDTTVFYIDYEFGAPWKIVNALGDSTVLTRGTALFPALVTQVRQPNGHIVSATYDARGNVSSTSNIGTTQYNYTDPNWPDFVTKVIPPTVTDFVELGYDATTGNRIWQQDARGSSSRVNFRYYASPSVHANMLRAVQAPLNSATQVDSVSYDGQGNLLSTLSAGGSQMIHQRDGVGRDTLTLSDIDAGEAQLKLRRTFDVVDRLLQSSTIAPAMSHGYGAQTNTVTNTYDLEGRLATVTRGTTPPLVTQFVRDRAGRIIKEIAPDQARDSTVYDKSGNVAEFYPRGLTGTPITFSYDELNQLETKTVPSRSYQLRDQNLSLETGLAGFNDAVENPSYPRYPNDGGTGYVISAETSTYTYDAVGNMMTAVNGSAEVTRTWNPDGTLGSETLKIGTVANPTDLTVHAYTTTYGYDAAGRRTTITHPTSLAAPGYQTGYAYDALLGSLETVTDPEGNTYRFSYNLNGQPDSLVLGSSLYEVFGYDADGQLIGHDLHNPLTGSLAHPQAQLRGDVITYDLRGKVTASTSSFGSMDQFTAKYSGLGHLVDTELTSDGTNVLGNNLNYRQRSIMAYDELGNLLANRDTTTITVGGTTGANPLGSQSSNNVSASFYDQAGVDVGRLSSIARTDRSTSYEYDEAGNTAFQQGSPGNPWGNSQGAWDDRASFYDWEGRLVAADRGFMENKTGVKDPFFRRVFQEYRYDALGRRVLVYTRQFCANAENSSAQVPQAEPLCNIDYARRTVWDGSRESWEIQMPDTLGLVENDTASITQNLSVTSPNFTDMNKLWGRTAYTYSGAVDKPLGIHRFGYRDNFNDQGVLEWPPFTIIPHWNFRGDADNGSFGDGNKFKPHPADATRTVDIAWPAGWFAYWRRDADIPTAWHGTILVDKMDAAGTMYRRNRYYDPGSGQFTQEDPIGLAGGLNLYGFAGGDPVNFSDPFGLMPCKGPGDPECVAKGVLVGAAIGTSVGVVVATGCAVVSGGICTAGAPAIVGASAGFGGSVGGLAGSLEGLVEPAVNSIRSGLKRLIRAIVIGAGLGSDPTPVGNDELLNPRPPSETVQPPARPTKPKDPRDPEDPEPPTGGNGN